MLVFTSSTLTTNNVTPQPHNAGCPQSLQEGHLRDTRVIGSLRSNAPCKDSAASAREGIGVLLPENVSNPAARDDFQTSAALPHTK